MEDNKDNDSESKTLYSKLIQKMNKAGTRQVGALKIEVKEFEGYKFVQITQRKESFGTPGTTTHRPAKETWVTFDPKNDEVKKAFQEAFKI